MPYIIPAWRKLIDPSIKDIVRELERFDGGTVDGVVNYAFTNILLNTYLPDSYLDYERIIGLLECIKLEMYRKAVAPYEDQKAKENGDVY